MYADCEDPMKTLDINNKFLERFWICQGKFFYLKIHPKMKTDNSKIKYSQ